MATMMNIKGTTLYNFKIGSRGNVLSSVEVTNNNATSYRLCLDLPDNPTADQINQQQIPTMQNVKDYILGFSTASNVSMTMGSYNLTANTGVTINSKKIKAVITGYTIDTTNETINLTIEDVDVAPSN